jgi:hypothetical protein
MMSFKSKSAKRSVVAVVGAAAAAASMAIGTGPADAVGYVASCSGFPSTVHRGITYSTKCSHYPPKKAFSVFERQINGKGRKAHEVQYLLGRGTSGHLGNVKSGFTVSEHIHLGTQNFHFAAGGKTYIVQLYVRR